MNPTAAEFVPRFLQRTPAPATATAPAPQQQPQQPFQPQPGRPGVLVIPSSSMSPPLQNTNVQAKSNAPITASPPPKALSPPPQKVKSISLLLI